MIAWGPRLKDPLQMWRWGKVLFSWRSSTGCEPSLSHRSSNEIQVYSDECVCVEHLNRCQTSTWWCRFWLFVLFSFFLFVMLCQPQLPFSTSISILEQGAGAHGKSPANEDTYHRRWYQTWPVWRTCIGVITCCSGFASIQFSFSDDEKSLNPRTSMAVCAIFCTVVAICQLISSSIDFGDSIFSLISRVFSPTHSGQV